MFRIPELPSSQQPCTRMFPRLLSSNLPCLTMSAFVWGFLCQEHLEGGRATLGHNHTSCASCAGGNSCEKTELPLHLQQNSYLNELQESLQAQGQFLQSSTWDVCVWVPLLMLSMLHQFLLLRLRNTKRSPSSPIPCPRHTRDYKRSACTSQK